MPTLVYTATEGTAPSPLELVTPSQNVVRPLLQDLAAVVALLGGPLGTTKGVAVDGVAGVLQDLTGFQQAENWRRGSIGIGVGSIQTVPAASGTIDVVLNPTTTILIVQSTGNVVLRSMGTPAPPAVSDEGREILIVHDRASGSGFVTLPHNAGGIPAGNSPFFNSNLRTVVLGQTSAYIARAFFGRWRSNDYLAASVPIVVAVPALAAGVLGYANAALVTTALEGAVTNAPVLVTPQSDLAAAGAAAGYLIGARISAASTLRCAFVGTLAGGNATFNVSLL